MKQCKTSVAYSNTLAARTAHCGRRGWTIFEVVAVILLFPVPIYIGLELAGRFAPWVGVAGGLASFSAAVLVVGTFYRVAGRLKKQKERELAERFPSVYRVLALPNDMSDIVKAKWAEIEVGDYGWEAEPIRNDGRVYLQGLTEDWRVVWHAGFSSDQIVIIGAKPRSQYYLPDSWGCKGSNPPRCPFPVRTHPTSNLGLPSRIIGNFVQGKRV